MARKGICFYQVQGQLSATCDGWDSSRQLPTVIVGAVDELAAATQVSHLAWDMSARSYVYRTTYATVTEVVNGDNGDVIPVGDLVHVKVKYVGGTIHAHAARTYAELQTL